jgi:uncharacterized protein YecT (DUF1311 family)
MKRAIRFVFFAPLAVLSSHLDAASFNCAAAQAPVEQIICDDADINNLDTQLGAAYRHRLALDPKFLEDQRAWISNRNKSCNVPVKIGAQADLARVKACLVKFIGERIKELEQSKLSPSNKTLSSEPTESGIAWVPERATTGCTDIQYQFPASMVPIQDDGAHTGGPEWFSFDRSFSFYFEDKASYFGAPRQSHDEYISMPKCTAGFDASAIELEKERVLQCEDTSNKVHYLHSRLTTDNESQKKAEKTGYCGVVFAIAPDINDDSRFVSYLQLCGPDGSQNEIWSATHHIFESSTLKYLGCCAKDKNYLGCHIR